LAGARRIKEDNAPMSQRVFFVFVFLFAVKPVFACDCIGRRSPESEFSKASVVFSGTVRSLKQLPDSSSIIEFTVIDSFKGPRTKTIRLIHGGTDCDRWFELNSSYLVYAFGSMDELETSSCNRGQPLDKATHEIRLLRMIKPKS